mmetsp:Transcript_23493/g.54357  ORF Transcript_23493/g.54357 Transcript_23493/m.54357 type:complete len:222 (-) Transcript_23493:609-1274(-)
MLEGGRRQDELRGCCGHTCAQTRSPRISRQHGGRTAFACSIRACAAAAYVSRCISILNAPQNTQQCVAKHTLQLCAFSRALGRSINCTQPSATPEAKSPLGGRHAESPRGIGGNLRRRARVKPVSRLRPPSQRGTRSCLAHVLCLSCEEPLGRSEGVHRARSCNGAYTRKRNSTRAHGRFMHCYLPNPQPTQSAMTSTNGHNGEPPRKGAFVDVSRTSRQH